MLPSHSALTRAPHAQSPGRQRACWHYHAESWQPECINDTVRACAWAATLPDLGGVSRATDALIVCSYLAANQLSGTLPSSLGSLTALQQLCVSCACNLHHAADKSALPRVCSYLQSNQLSGPIPASFGSLTALQTLYALRCA